MKNEKEDGKDLVISVMIFASLWLAALSMSLLAAYVLI